MDWEGSVRRYVKHRNASGAHPSALRWKNWKFYYVMVPPTPTGAFAGATTYSWTLVDNIKRDPFEQNIGEQVKSFMATGAPVSINLPS